MNPSNHQKNPIICGVLNTIFWGGGYFYLGDTKKGIFTLVVNTLILLPIIILTGMFGLPVIMIATFYNGWKAAMDFNGLQESAVLTLKSMTNGLIIMVVVFLVTSLILTMIFVAIYS